MTGPATMHVEDAVSEKAVEIAKSAIKEGLTMRAILNITGLDESTIKRLQDEASND